MKKTLYVLAVASLFAGIAGTAACGGDDEGGGGNGGGGTGGPCDDIAAMVSSADATAGEATYTSLCGSSSCHGPNGDDGASNAGDLTSAIPSLSDAQVCQVIVDGEGQMPPQSQLSDQEVADVIAYCNQTF